MKHKAKYTSDMPRLLYAFFVSQADEGRLPSFAKFARSIKATPDDIERFRKNAEFERAYRASNEIRRDYLTEAALTRRYDGSFTKFILAAEYGMGEKDKENDGTGLDVTLKVLSGSKNEA